MQRIVGLLIPERTFKSNLTTTIYVIDYNTMYNAFLFTSYIIILSKEIYTHTFIYFHTYR